MPTFIRFKLPGARVLEVDVNAIVSLCINADEYGEYVLCAFSSTQIYDLCYGTFAQCHELLNQLHDILNIDIIDV